MIYVLQEMHSSGFSSPDASVPSAAKSPDATATTSATKMDEKQGAVSTLGRAVVGAAAPQGSAPTDGCAPRDGGDPSNYTFYKVYNV